MLSMIHHSTEPSKRMNGLLGLVTQKVLDDIKELLPTSKLTTKRQGSDKFLWNKHKHQKNLTEYAIIDVSLGDNSKWHCKATYNLVFKSFLAGYGKVPSAIV